MKKPRFGERGFKRTRMQSSSRHRSRALDAGRRRRRMVLPNAMADYMLGFAFAVNRSETLRRGRLVKSGRKNIPPLSGPRSAKKAATRRPGSRSGWMDAAHAQQPANGRRAFARNRNSGSRQPAEPRSRNERTCRGLNITRQTIDVKYKVTAIGNVGSICGR
jgi:hypothetical protein